MSKSYFPSDSGHPEFTQHQTSERAWMDLPIGHCSDPAYDKFPFHTVASFILYKKNVSFPDRLGSYLMPPISAGCCVAFRRLSCSSSLCCIDRACSSLEYKSVEWMWNVPGHQLLKIPNTLFLITAINLCIYLLRTSNTKFENLSVISCSFLYNLSKISLLK